MKLRKILLAVAGLALMLNASAQKSKRYYVAKPGTLVELMTEAEANEITQLTLQGKLNAVDFRHLRDEFKNLQLLDISNASISMYSTDFVPERPLPENSRYTLLRLRAKQLATVLSLIVS